MNVDVNLTPQLPLLAIQWLITLVLFYFVKTYLWNTVMELKNKRQKLSLDELRVAKEKRAEADKLAEIKALELDEARAKAKEIVSDSKHAATIVHDNIISSAKKSALMIKVNNDEAIELEKKRFEDSLKKQVVELSIAGAQLILEKELNPDDHVEMIDKFIEETY